MEVGLFRVTFLVISRLKSRPYETFRQMAINLLNFNAFDILWFDTKKHFSFLTVIYC